LQQEVDIRCLQPGFFYIDNEGVDRAAPSHIVRGVQTGLTKGGFLYPSLLRPFLLDQTGVVSKNIPQIVLRVQEQLEVSRSRMGLNVLLILAGHCLPTQDGAVEKATSSDRADGDENDRTSLIDQWAPIFFVASFRSPALL
jgi:hypothetical protein